MKRRLLLAAVMISLLVAPGAALAGVSPQEPPQNTPVAPDAPAAPLDRTGEPATVTGVLAGKPVDELFVYRWHGGMWEQIPFQIDERNASGAWVTSEDGVMDANDVLVFMSGDTGSLAPSPIADALPVSGWWYRVEVTNPLNPAAKGYVYVVHSTALTVTNPTDYVSYDAGALRVNTGVYSLGWAASGHNGLDTMSMFGGGDILDRTKLRIAYRFIVLFQLNEEDFDLETLQLIRDGAVRTLVKRGESVTESYDAFTRTTLPINLTALPGTLEQVRTSTDLANGVTGVYYDENNASGVAIDGAPDAVAQTPFTRAWRQITVGGGSNIMVARLTGLGGTRKHYYKDNAAVDPQDTGDQRSIGDSGFEVANPTSENFTIETGQYFLPAAQGNKGATYFQYFENPLQVVAVAEAQFSTYLPAMHRN